MNANTNDDPTPPQTMSEWLKTAIPELQAQAAKAAEHERTCTARPCQRCEKFICRCGAAVDGARECLACSQSSAVRAQLEPTVRSIPARFRWTVDAPAGLVTSRVKGDPRAAERGLAAPPSTSMMFFGPTGAGKTSLATAMLVAWVKASPAGRKGAIFVEASVLARARARFRLGAGEAPLVEDCMVAPLLLIDDLGQEREDRDGCITDVVYGRSNAELPTWVTCGLTDGETSLEAFAARLAARYDGGFMRRILADGKRVLLGGRS